MMHACRSLEMMAEMRAGDEVMMEEMRAWRKEMKMIEKRWRPIRKRWEANPEEMKFVAVHEQFPEAEAAVRTVSTEGAVWGSASDRKTP
jgi:hypothetical protein